MGVRRLATMLTMVSTLAHSRGHPVLERTHEHEPRNLRPEIVDQIEIESEEVVTTRATTTIYTPEECNSWISTLVANDENDSQGLSESEYYAFLSNIKDPPYIATYFEDYEGFDQLPWVFWFVHKSLACYCEKLGFGDECCVGDNAEVLLQGLTDNGNGGTARSRVEEEYRDSFCQQIAYVLTKSIPSPAPTDGPSISFSPTKSPSSGPTSAPVTGSPTLAPSLGPTISVAPTSSKPSISPTKSPSSGPTSAPVTGSPTLAPSVGPTVSVAPTSSKPSISPTKSPSSGPTSAPVTGSPTLAPSVGPTVSVAPTSLKPSTSPTKSPSSGPTSAPVTGSPTLAPSVGPTVSVAPTSSKPTATLEVSPVPNATLPVPVIAVRTAEEEAIFLDAANTNAAADVIMPDTTVSAPIYTPEECDSWINTLVANDENDSQGLSESEYYEFLSNIKDPPYIATYFENYDGFGQLPWVFRFVHKSLACHCEKLGFGSRCCMGRKAEVPIQGLKGNGKGGTTRSRLEEDYRDSFCQQISYVLTQSIPSPAPTATNGPSNSFSPTASPSIRTDSVAPNSLKPAAALEVALVPSTTSSIPVLPVPVMAVRTAEKEGGESGIGLFIGIIVACAASLVAILAFMAHSRVNERDRLRSFAGDQAPEADLWLPPTAVEDREREPDVDEESSAPEVIKFPHIGDIVLGNKRLADTPGQEPDENQQSLTLPF